MQLNSIALRFRFHLSYKLLQTHYFQPLKDNPILGIILFSATIAGNGIAP